MPEHIPGAFLDLDPDSCTLAALGRVLPVPYEATTTYQRGTARGPAALIAASQQVEHFDEWLDDEVPRYGARTVPPVECSGPPEELAVRLQHEVAPMLADGQFPLILGGEHSISLGPIRAALVRHPDLVVLHLDAHPDLRDEYQGTRYGHGCVMRRVWDLGARIHAFGIRAVSPEERDWYPTQDRAHAVLAREILPLAPRERVQRILEDLPPGPLWLSWDVDGLDPSVIPGTGTPEPGGIDWFTACEVLLRLDQEQRQVVGADLVELLPRAGDARSDFAAARLAQRMLLLGLRSCVRHAQQSIA